MAVLPGQDRWRATQAHLRALLLAGIGTAAAVVLRRPDLVVLVCPFIVISVWSVLTRPHRTPGHGRSMDRARAREGETVTWAALVEPVPGMEEVATSLVPALFSELEPDHGQRAVAIDRHLVTRGREAAGTATGDTEGSRLRVPTRLRTLRWGQHEVGPGLVAATSSWGAYRWGPVELPSTRLRTVPLPALFDGSAPTPHPRGLVGLNRSSRAGDGSEFASIRPFQVGDRLRRIHWSRSLRTGELHVTASHADQDSHVALLVDAHHELGRSGGVEGRASTLDLSVRAAAAVAEHFLHRGDRVSLRVVGDQGATRVPPSSGRRHLLRVLDRLAGIEPGTRQEEPERLGQLGLGAGTLVVMMSPLVSPDALAQAALLTRRGLTVVVVDTLGSDADALAPEADGLSEFAWRIRMLERDREIRAIRRSGVPVVPWRGPGSLDTVLRQLGSHHVRPGVVHR